MAGGFSLSALRVRLPAGRRRNGAGSLRRDGGGHRPQGRDGATAPCGSDALERVRTLLFRGDEVAALSFRKGALERHDCGNGGRV